MNTIQFGTSGYRGLLGSSFAISHVEVIVNAISVWLIGQRVQKIIIGYDPRTGNRLTDDPSFSRRAAEILSGAGIDVVLSSVPVPTPLISWYCRVNQCAGINFTASHNPPSYDGIKFNPPGGAPAPVAVTQKIEQLIESGACVSLGERPGHVTEENLIPQFVDYLAGYVRTFLGDPKGRSRVVVDARHGVSAAVWDALNERGCVDLAEVLNSSPLADFGGIEPNPTHKAALKELSHAVVRAGAAIGVGHDPDADRHVILDENGSVVSPEIVAVLIAEYAVRNKILFTGISTTIASSGIVKRATGKLGLTVNETPVGFKYFEPDFAAAEQSNARVLGVESSGGLSISDYLHEKCGFLPALLIAQIVESENKTLSRLVNDMRENYGGLYFVEDSFEFLNEDRDRINALLSDPDKLREMLQLDAPFYIGIDGAKLIFNDGDWLLIRLSGTEPVGRLYVESASLERAEHLASQLRRAFSD